MKRQKICRSILTLMMTLLMILPVSVVDTQAALGDLKNVDTGIDGDIDTNDIISLPIKILDYDSDGMLFEYAESKEAQSASDFGSKYAYDFTKVTSPSSDTKLTTNSIQSLWSGGVNLAVTTGTYANYAKLTWKGNTTGNNAVWSNNNAGVLLTDFSTSVNMSDLQYVVLVYRTNVEKDAIRFGIANGNGGAAYSGHQATFYMTQKGATGDGSQTNWTYAVFDLKTGGEETDLKENCPDQLKITDWTTTTGIYAGLPLDAAGEYMDIAHVAYFSNKKQAEKFGEYALTDGSDRGDNRAFGLLRGSRTETDTTGSSAYKGVADAVDSVKQLNTYSSATIDYSQYDLGYKLLGTFAAKGIANIGLLESTLSEDGYPVYKQAVVEYFAGLLKASLEIPERTSDGWKNYKYIKGTASERYGGTDLATALRKQINGKLGSYAETANKELIGTWEVVGKNITTYHDAAYFLLNNIFRDNSYNELQDDYDYLVLSAGQDKKFGNKAYGFDGGFTDSSDSASAKSAVKYDAEKRIIQNTSATGKTHFVYEVSGSSESTTTLNPFLPITSKNNSQGQTMTPYYQDDGVLSTGTTKDTLVNRNYGFAMVSEGEFVYHADDELFFDFEGDDDVYLFINNELVMDIGSAHSIDGARIELNDYVNAAKAGTLGSAARNQALNLQEGNAYTFKFYYMERHSYGSNIRVNTNIRVTDPSMITTKTAWQEGNRLDYGSVIETDKIVEYGFAITNNGKQNLFDLAFEDYDIGVKLDENSGLTVTDPTRVFDVNGEKLEATDLVATVEHPDYADIIVHFADNEALKVFLKDLSAEGTQNEQGLFIGATVTFRGIGYKLTEKQIEDGYFDNTVFSTATNKNGKTLYGQDNMRVYAPMSLIYYQWAGHDLKVTKESLIEYIIRAAANNQMDITEWGVTTTGIEKLELTTKSGHLISDDSVQIDNNNDITFNYPKAGSNYIYIKVTYDQTHQLREIIVPISVMVTSVEDSVYVLDYGLKVDLGEKLIDLAKDAVLAPGRATSYMAEGITGEVPSYNPNSITFKKIEGTTLAGKNGTFNWSGEDGQTLTYQPTDFMDEPDTIYAAIRVKENDYTIDNPIGTVDINNEVEMYKSVTVLPATVVYYEDNFPAIHYEGTTNTIEADATVTNLESAYNRVEGGELTQDKDQNENYGHDNVYAVAGNTESSGGTLTTITVKGTGQVASFEFKGTGLELISRTTAEAGAIIVVNVKDSQGNVVKNIPVITEFDNTSTGKGGDEKIYQVPVIRINDLNLGTYTVTITGIQRNDYTSGEAKAIDSYLYVDGLRIYQPLGDTNENYTPEENGAVFDEIRNKIAEGEVAVVKWNTDADTSISSGTNTWVENRNGDEEITGNKVGSVNDYLLYGPNNEVYLSGKENAEALMFYVAEDSSKETHNLQIAMRGLDAGSFAGTGSTGVSVPIKYAVAAEDGTIQWQDVTTLISSTELYYTIDYTKCPKIEGIGYQVVILVEQAENSMVSFTTIKYNGLNIVSKKSDGSSIFSDKASFNFKEGMLWKDEPEEGGSEPSEPEPDTSNSPIGDYGELLSSYAGQEGTYGLTASSRMYVVSDQEPTGEVLQTVRLANSQFAASYCP